MEFSQFISSVSDFRRGQGLRYSFDSLMWVIFLAVCCGHTSSRCISAFCKSEEGFLTKIFSWKHGVPNYGTIHYFLRGLDSAKMCAAFNSWMDSNFGDKLEASWISGDGQALRSTLSASGTCSQSYSVLVSLFCQQIGLTIAIKAYKNQSKGEGEQGVFLSLLLDNLTKKGIMFTLDALHCQKKH
jgi:DDE_Tnp_1-associated